MGRVPRRSLIGRVVATLSFVPWSECTDAQAAMPRMEVYSTIGGIVGVTPMRIDGIRRAGAHAGFRADAGIQTHSERSSRGDAAVANSDVMGLFPSVGPATFNRRSTQPKSHIDANLRVPLS